MHRINADGKEHGTVYIKALTAELVLTASRVDIQIVDASGNVVTDTKAERIAHTERVMALVAKHKPNDPTLRSMLASNHEATRDPDHALFHLYSIYDALQHRFGGEGYACKAIGISVSRSSRLRKLANSAPLRQGRHPGQKDPGQLRDATRNELAEAQSIAREMIERYLTYLDAQQTSPPPTQSVNP